MARHFCDFDCATIWRGNSWRFARVREHDREMLDYFFDGRLLTDREFRLALAPLAREERSALPPPLLRAGVPEFRGGFPRARFRAVALSSSLPDVMGLSILALGAGNGVVPLEMLRAGARRVTAWEQDPILARYARLNHRWFEFTDNPGTPASRFWRAGPKRLPRGTGPDTTW
jgi:hypothetical protein